MPRGQRPLRDAIATVATGVAVAAVVAGWVGQHEHAAGGARVLAALVGAAPAALSAGAVLRRSPRTSTSADRVTMGRAVLACGCAAATVLVLAGPVPARTWWLVGLAVPTLLLDAVDGWVARRTGSATAAGALLDMQVDAGVLVVLSLAAEPVVGAWVVLIGAMRYLFVVASWVWPVLLTSLPRSQFRRVVAGLQGAALVVALAPVVPVALARAITGGALVLLLSSFGQQVVAIRRHGVDSRGRRSSSQ